MSSSEHLFRQSQQFIPGGVNSPVRAFYAVGGVPPFMDHGRGCYLFDVDGHRYIDYVMSWGAMIAGHANDSVVQRVKAIIDCGLSFGTPTKLELQMAEKLCSIIPNLEQVRMVNSGTEATMSALRLARGATGRDLIIKFEGCYHGHHDSLLVKSGSGALTMGVASSLGVSEEVAKQTLVLPYNDSIACQQLLTEKGSEIAAIIVEPVAGNMNCIPPEPRFLQTLRELCDQYGILLIFDEVMTGFRVARGGAQALYGVHADIITLGKIIGGGLPVGAYGGRRELMELIAPQGSIYQAGTLSGNPIAMAAGLASLEMLDDDVYDRLDKLTRHLLKGLVTVAHKHGIPLTTNQVGSMMGLFFTPIPEVNCYAQATACNEVHFKDFFHGMLAGGIYLAPSPYEAGFLSIAHDSETINYTIDVAERVFMQMAKKYQ